IGGLGFAAAASVWLAPWVTMNLAALLLGTLSWNEDRRIQKESATAMHRQAKARAAQWRKLEERQCETQRREQAPIADQLRQAEQRRRQEEDEREAQRKLQAALSQAEEQLREAEQRRRQEEEERQTRRQRQNEQAERLRQAEHEQKRSREDGKLEDEC